MPFFKNVFRSKDSSRSASRLGANADGPSAAPLKPRWEDAWSRSDVAPEEIQELVHVCTQEMKSRALDMPFLLLPFRPSSDPSAARNFIRNFFKAAYEGTRQFVAEGLSQELRLAEPLTLCSVIKWCWSRMPGGVVTWDVYELFRIGESDSNLARHAFDTFIPLSVESEARRQIIIDFFDLLAAIAARAKSNGLGGRALSRMAGWWAFEFADHGKGFDGGYRAWERAADAASHLFFAYLRCLAPDANTVGGISALPRSLEALLSQTEYPPQAPLLLQSTTTKIVMIVDSVSPTPFALLRRAKHFEYRDDDEALQAFSAYEDTVSALTDECRRVLACISSANQSVLSADHPNQDPSWSRFEDLGFSGLIDGAASGTNGASQTGLREFSALRGAPFTRVGDNGRPTTPSWADFLSSGFTDENKQTSPATLLPPSAKLPPIGEAGRVQSSQSHIRNGVQNQEELEPGELASITQFNLEDTFWWVWITSLASEETGERKAAFGRCSLIETKIHGAKWLVVEEQIKGAITSPEEGAYIAEKKSKFSWTKRGRLGRRKSTGKKHAPGTKAPYNRAAQNSATSKTSIGPDQHARIQAAAAKLAQGQRDQQASDQLAQRRARIDETTSTKTNSVLTLQPHLLTDAAPAMKWDKKFGEGAHERDALRAQYLGDIYAGKGAKTNEQGLGDEGAPTADKKLPERDLPTLPQENFAAGETTVASPSGMGGTTSPEASLAGSPKPAAFDAPQTHYVQDAATTSTVDGTPDHRAYRPSVLRKAVPERKPAPVPMAVPSEAHHDEDQNLAPRHEAQVASPQKVKKREGGGGGLRKLFGKKKTEHVAQPPQATHNEAHTQDVVAPYDAMQQGDAHVASPAYNADSALTGRSYPLDVEPSPAVSAISATSREPALQVVPDMREQEEAEASFARFDEGPMVDMPACLPEEEEDTDEPMPSIPSHVPEIVAEDATFGHGPAAMDDISEESVDALHQSTSPQDRWAQIRKNAAERAARLSEEQSGRSVSQSVRTDEGETSGEETIESRVARIKARVAELTGNAEGPPPSSKPAAIGARL